MSAFEVFTWLAIVVLLVGSIAVFAWFLVDLARQTDARSEQPGTQPDRRDL